MKKKRKKKKLKFRENKKINVKMNKKRAKFWGKNEREKKPRFQNFSS